METPLGVADGAAAVEVPIAQAPSPRITQQNDGAERSLRTRTCRMTGNTLRPWSAGPFVVPLSETTTS